MGLPHLLLILAMALLLSAAGFSGYRLHHFSAEQKQLKEDHAAANDITLGLFSIAQWQTKVAAIVKRQVKGFALTKSENRQLQEQVEDLLLALINKAQALLEKPATTFSGKIKKFAVRKFVDVDKIKAQVPSYAKAIMAKVNDPANKKQLTAMAMSKIAAIKNDPYVDSAFHTYDSVTSAIYHKYNIESVEQLNAKINNRLEEIKTEMYNYSSAMLACIVTVLVLWWVFRKRLELHATLFVMSLLFAFILLAVGISASMIEVDARIPAVDFTLLGEHIVFKDQVLFFQTKSILDVVHVLMTQPDAQSKAVGILILVFSILFPVTKLMSTGIHLLANRRWAESRFVRYFAFESGKWSMADVIVIAILMAYIGLNGLLQQQLARMHVPSDSLTIIATNNTALQPGYIIFISYVLYGLVLSTILKFITPHNAASRRQTLRSDTDNMNE